MVLHVRLFGCTKCSDESSWKMYLSSQKNILFERRKSKKNHKQFFSTRITFLSNKYRNPSIPTLFDRKVNGNEYYWKWNELNSFQTNQFSQKWNWILSHLYRVTNVEEEKNKVIYFNKSLFNLSFVPTPQIENLK